MKSQIIEILNKFRNEPLHHSCINQVAEEIHKLYDNQWISVDTRLPLDGQYILSVDNIGRVYNSVFHEKRNEFKCVGLVWEHDNVTHWMPLPSPPEEKEE